eukprot:NODE_1016_length_712_cov_1489.458522_g555_i1.p1 GENE.NODE_1016_length_712_cov_1489.458522_g555_i1~~NODE_1016_length_712_cov_1489.458522_g555_i1.p1  ORF type:complete len:152 (+),score=47.34 NODE_1016_length_712_cov_1489.458522_g555_i1:32-457(+)
MGVEKVRGLFKNCRFCLHPEVPLEALSLVIRSFGGVLEQTRTLVALPTVLLIDQANITSSLIPNMPSRRYLPDDEAGEQTDEVVEEIQQEDKSVARLTKQQRLEQMVAERKSAVEALKTPQQVKEGKAKSCFHRSKCSCRC